MMDIQTAHGFRAHISDNRFNIVRQPVVCARTSEVLHHEWLVRFDSQKGLESIIRPAEISGAISDLDISMLSRAVETLNKHPQHQAIAVNLSGASFSNPNFENTLLGILSTFKAPAKKLIFELTETWHLKNLEPVVRLITILRDRGHAICLDDVGAGAASIRYLRAFPADWLKIDGNFVMGALGNDRELAVLNALLGLRDALGVRFIAEGIETEKLLEFARNTGFDALQGYFVGAPEPEIAE